MDYNTLLNEHGFNRYKLCRACTGVLEAKYNNAQAKGYDIVIQPERDKYFIREYGINKSSGPISQLEEALNTLGI